MASLPLEAGAQFTISDDGALLRRSVLPGGVRLLTSALPHVHSAFIGFWVGAGSRDEAPGTYGSTHFLEHLLFKGTGRRTALQVSEESDYMGGAFNAATGRQHTAYYGHVFEADMGRAVDLLADMVTSARLDAQDFATERGVILEELAMYADDAADVAQEQLPQQVFGSHPLGRPVGGTAETVRALQHEALLRHYRSVYRPEELVVVAAGAVDHDRLADMVLTELAKGGWELRDDAVPAPRRQVSDIDYPAGTTVSLTRDVEQAAVTFGVPAIALQDSRLSTEFALSTILGGGTSSRLFQEIREKHGLAYSTYAFPAAYREGGLFGMFAACAPAATEEVAGIMNGELDRIARDGVSEAEVESAFRRQRADIVFDGEHIASTMNRMATSELVRGELISQHEHVRRARAVNAADIQALAVELAAGPRSTVTVGPAK